MKALIVVIAIYAMTLAWIGKRAAALGCNIVLWTLSAALLGGLGFAGGLAFAMGVIEGSDTSIAMLSLLMPLALMLAGVGVVGYLLQRSSLTTRRSSWPVHVMKRGPGTLRIERDRIIVQWDQGVRDVALANLKSVELDGECVRVNSEDDEMLLMPLDEALSSE